MRCVLIISKMQDISNVLLIIQASLMGVSLTLFFALVLSSLQKTDTTKAYEIVRWLLAFAMLLFAVHYIMQMVFGFRAQGDDVGAVVNILFYSPIAYILSYSILRIGCGNNYYRKFRIMSITGTVLIFCTFVGGYLYYGSMHMKGALYIMGLLYFFSIVLFIIYPMKEIRRIRKMVDEESGQEPVLFNMYMRTCTKLLWISALCIAFSIFYTPLLVIIGPFFFIALVFYIVCFLALGYNIRQMSNIIVAEVEDEVNADGGETGTVAVKAVMSEERKEMTKALIEGWIKNQGYASSEINSTLLATRLNIPKRQLVQYLREVEGKTFRIWLSDLRLEEAKRLIIEHLEYSTETVAESCGFSRSHLQVKFKEATGFTTNEWRDNHARKS